MHGTTPDANSANSTNALYQGLQPHARKQIENKW